MSRLLRIVFIGGLIFPQSLNARPISDDIEELNLKAELAFSEIGEAAAGNFIFEIQEVKDAKITKVFGHIRHRKSGLVCAFNADEEVNIFVFKEAENGEVTDFSCNIKGYGYDKTVYGYLERADLPSELIAAKVAIEYRFPGANEYILPKSDFVVPATKVDLLETDYFKNSSFAAYDIEIEGKRLISSVWLYDAGDWFFKMRYSIAKEKNRDSVKNWQEVLTLSLGENK